MLTKQEREAARKMYLKVFDNGDGTVTGRFKIPAFARGDVEQGGACVDRTAPARHRWQYRR